MIAARRLQLHFGDGFVAEAVEDLWEPWMRHADLALEDDALLLLIQQELAKRCQKSKTRGRKATPAEVVLPMLLLKHVRDWSFETLTREVRANLLGGQPVAKPDVQFLYAFDPPYSSRQIRAEEPAIWAQDHLPGLS